MGAFDVPGHMVSGRFRESKPVRCGWKRGFLAYRSEHAGSLRGIQQQQRSLKVEDGITSTLVASGRVWFQHTSEDQIKALWDLLNPIMYRRNGQA